MQLNNYKTGSTFNMSARFKGHSANINSSSTHEIKILYNNLNGTQIGQTRNWSGNIFKTIIENNQTLSLDNGVNIFYLLNSSSDQNSLPYLDYFQLDYAKKLNFDENYSFFSPIESQNVRFDFERKNPNGIFFWDISDPTNVLDLYIDDLGFCNVQISDDGVNQFIVFNINEISEISTVYQKNNQYFNQLRNSTIQANYIIIGPEEFRDASNDLLEIRRPSIYASLEIIYDEFSAGNSDPMAIRNFIQWSQEYWADPAPNTVLLLGDGGYDYRNINGYSSIVVPTIQVNLLEHMQLMISLQLFMATYQKWHWDVILQKIFRMFLDLLKKLKLLKIILRLDLGGKRLP